MKQRLMTGNICIWLALCLLLTACGSTRILLPRRVSSLQPQPTPVTTPTLASNPITARNVAELIERSVYPSTKREPVAAVTFTSDAQELLAVQALGGKLSRWRVASGELLAVLDVGPVGVVSAAFGGGGRVVATGAGQTVPAMEAGFSVTFDGMRVWDTSTGELLLETSPPGARYRVPLQDVAVSQDGKWAGELGRVTIVWNIETGERMSTSATFLQPKGDDFFAQLTAMTFDPTGTWYAEARYGYGILLEEWIRNASYDRIFGTSDETTTLALAIDPARRYLAVVTTDSFGLWGLQDFWKRRSVNIPVSPSPAAALAFSPDSSLLAVGTAEGWQIWSVEERALLLEQRTGTFAVTFSPDGRLFAWGDMNGTVHVWGVPE